MELQKIFFEGLSLGFLYGILFMTGQSIDSLDILVQFGDAMATALENIIPSINLYWNILKWIIIIVGFLLLFKIIYDIWSFGRQGIFAAIIGFIGAFMLFLVNFSPYLTFAGVIVLVLGSIWSQNPTPSS